MGRRRGSTSILVELIRAPWWASCIVATVVYLGLTELLPRVACPGTDCSQLVGSLARTVSGMMQAIALPLAALFLLPVPFSMIHRWKRRRLLDRQSGIESIRLLDWDEFERLLGEVYRRRGYRVRENPHAGPDGGVDLRLENRRGLYLVQCKQWRTNRVGAPIVRELYGVMAGEGAFGGAVVTSGGFTGPARAFAEGKAIDLIDGDRLVAMIAEIREGAVAAPGKRRPRTDTNNDCPRCGGTLVLRRAKRGPNAGNNFYGCSSYPGCRYVRETG